MMERSTTMTKGFVRFYELTERFSFSDLVSQVRGQGAFLEHPYGGGAYVSLLSHEGAQSLELIEALYAKVARRPGMLGFQFWFDPSSDIYCRLRFIGDLVSIDLGFDSLDLEYLLKIIDLSLARSESLASFGALMGLVLDGTGGTDNFDWDEFFQRGKPLTLPWLPDVIGINKSQLDQIEYDVLRHYSTRSVEDILFLTRKWLSWEEY
jgi:hypothetical protein